MVTQDGMFWTLDAAVMERRSNPVISFCYYYRVEDQAGQVLRKEWQRVGRRYAADSSKTYVLHDIWHDIPMQYHLYTDAYATAKGTGHLKDVEATRVPFFRKTLVFRVSAPQLNANESLAVVGSHPMLGFWNPSHYLPMNNIGEYEWILSVNVDGITAPVEYKYVVIDNETNSLKKWEEGENRTTSGVSVGDGEVHVLYGEPLRMCEEMWRIAGLVVPVFSLRSEHSYGTGDFGDLRRMVDWAVATGIKMIQVLPVNDTTVTHSWRDSNPYNIISMYALHPNYLDIEQLGELEDRGRMKSYLRKRSELNAMSYCDYPAVGSVKMSYVRDKFKECGTEVLDTQEYRDFYDNNKHWLIPYGAYCVLRDKFKTEGYKDWGQYKDFSFSEAERLCCAGSPYYNKVREIFFLQFILFKQLKDAAEYARACGIVLKGTLPPGVSRDSVETWTHGDCFNMDADIGTPPDRDMPNGQNWGYPAYNWDIIAKDGFKFWHDRLSWMEQFFDAFCMEYVIGYFRCWEIPAGAIYSFAGHYLPALPFSAEEIETFGLPFRRELFVCPFINDNVLKRIFGIHVNYVRENFLVSKEYGLYDLKPEYRTHTQINNCFKGRNDENSLWIRDGLMRLSSNVLFIPDDKHEAMFHPRFAAYNEPVYEILNHDEKDAFMRIYNNYFYGRHNDYWAMKAARNLAAMLGTTRMLVCAEDLELRTTAITAVLDRMRILSLEVQGKPKSHGYEFAHLEANPYLSVATFSTHGMSPMRLWWEENPGRTQRYYTSMLQKEGRAPQSLTPQLAEEIIARHLYCPSMICSFLLQDWLAMDCNLSTGDAREERIDNLYGSDGQWKYRMSITIEQLMQATRFNNKIKTMITRSKR